MGVGRRMMHGLLTGGAKAATASAMQAARGTPGSTRDGDIDGGVTLDPEAITGAEQIGDEMAMEPGAANMQGLMRMLEQILKGGGQ
jgi:hypothetical protein